MLDATGRFCLDLKAHLASDLPQEAQSSGRWLSLLGTSGAGKTLLAKRIWNWYRRSSMFESRTVKDRAGRDEIVYPGQWCWWPGLAGQLAGNDGYDRITELENETLVVFDEIGADRDPSGHVRNHLTRCLCARVGKWTVITSNKTLAQIDSDIDTRLASRMIRDGSEIVEVDVPDYSLS